VKCKCDCGLDIPEHRHRARNGRTRLYILGHAGTRRFAPKKPSHRFRTPPEVIEARRLLEKKFRKYGPSAPKTQRLCECGCGKEPLGSPSRFCAGHWVRKYGVIEHGMSGTPVHCAYVNAKRRCTARSLPCWETYGGRGIEFRFSSFEQWLKELGPRPSPEHSVDRENPNGHYEPGNVRWATKDVQAQNQRNKWIIEHEEEPDEFEDTGVSFNPTYRVTATMYF
jgi:hypothetical protein